MEGRGSCEEDHRGRVNNGLRGSYRLEWEEKEVVGKIIEEG
jgi:hypothetical protein